MEKELVESVMSCVIPKITRIVENIVFEELTKHDRLLEYDDFYIKIYNRVNGVSYDYFINNHYNEIYKFMDNGYSVKFTNGFKSECHDARELKKNSVEIKIAYGKNDEMIACSVYSGYLDGYKCVGITTTVNETLRPLGKIALQEIIKYDINHYDSFYWCECSEAIEHYYNKFDGFKIPNVYASSILDSRNIIDAHSNITLDEDDYHYFRQIKNIDEPQRKIIYGFNNEETLKMVIRNRESAFNAWVERVEGCVNEEYDVPNIVDVSFELVDIFSIYINEWGYEYFSHFALATLKKYMVLLKAEIDSDRHYSRYSKSEMIETYELGMEWNGMKFLMNSFSINSDK